MNMNVKFLIKPRKYPIIRRIKSSPLRMWQAPLFWVMGLSCLMASCINDTDLVDETYPEGQNVQFTLNTRSFNPGTDEQINTIRVIQVTRNVSQSIRSNTFVNNPTDPLTIQGISGDFDIYVIANESDNLGSALDGLQGLTNLEAMKKVVLPYTIANRTASNIPMFGVVERVTITSDPATTPSASNAAHIKVDGVDKGTTLSMSLTRLAIKINLHLRGKSFSLPKQVVFKNLPGAVPLFSDIPYEPTADKTTSYTVPALVDGTVETGYIWDKTADGIILPYYMLTNPGSNDKAAKLEVTLVNDKTVGTFIGHSAKNDPRDYTLHQNTVYSLTGNVDADKLSMEATVANWTPKDQDYPAGGGSFWQAEPQNVRVGLDGTEAEKTAVFTAKFATNATFSYKWYRRYQKQDMNFGTEELVSGVNGVTIITATDKSSKLTIIANSMDISGEIYCVGITTSLDGAKETLESKHATLMVVGTETAVKGTYLDIQNWIAPRNAILGSTCLLRDDRDNKLYRVKLMADGNWWMIQDLAYGEQGLKNAFSEDAILDYDGYYSESPVTKVGSNTYFGAAMESGKSTGGYLYNTHAALQFTEIVIDDRGADYPGFGLKHQLIPSLCPEGWHLPGNLKDELNYEWISFCDKIPGLSLGKFDYNSAENFNAYTDDGSGTYNFHGGYYPAKSNRNKPVSYCTLLISEEYSINDIYVGTEVSDRTDTSEAYPIRCVRNASK